MKLPKVIEDEIRLIEDEMRARGGQQAGTPRLRGLRGAIESVLQEMQPKASQEGTTRCGS
jgi:hypothetical protein